MRSKSRYVVVEIISEKAITFEEFTSALWQSMLGFLGELTTGEARIWPIKNLWNIREQRGVLKCSRDRVEHLRLALALITMIGESRAAVHITGVTGTIKSASNKYLGMPSLAAFQSPRSGTTAN
jgi:ribonuclease P/MRP protein subunit POP5